jgi:hypothetical protein
MVRSATVAIHEVRLSSKQGRKVIAPDALVGTFN